MAPSISDGHVHFGFNDDELLCNPRLFRYLLSLLKSCLWRQRNDYRFKSKPPSAVGLIASIKGRLSFDSPLFFKHYRSGAATAFFNVDGVPMGTLVKSLVTLFFVFNFHWHGVVSVCLLFVECVLFCSLRSLSLALMWCLLFWKYLLVCEVFSCTCLPSRCSSRSPLSIPFVNGLCHFERSMPPLVTKPLVMIDVIYSPD